MHRAFFRAAKMARISASFMLAMVSQISSLTVNNRCIHQPSLAFGLIFMAFLVAIYTICATRLNVVFVCLFFTLTIALICLAVSYWYIARGNDTVGGRLSKVRLLLCTNPSSAIRQATNAYTDWRSPYVCCLFPSMVLLDWPYARCRQLSTESPSRWSHWTIGQGKDIWWSLIRLEKRSERLWVSNLCECILYKHKMLHADLLQSMNSRVRLLIRAEEFKIVTRLIWANWYLSQVRKVN